MSKDGETYCKCWRRSLFCIRKKSSVTLLACLLLLPFAFQRFSQDLLPLGRRDGYHVLCALYGSHLQVTSVHSNINRDIQCVSGSPQLHDLRRPPHFAVQTRPSAREDFQRSQLWTQTPTVRTQLRNRSFIVRFRAFIRPKSRSAA